MEVTGIVAGNARRLRERRHLTLEAAAGGALVLAAGVWSYFAVGDKKSPAEGRKEET